MAAWGRGSNWRLAACSLQLSHSPVLCRDLPENVLRGSPRVLTILPECLHAKGESKPEDKGENVKVAEANINESEKIFGRVTAAHP